MNTLTVAALVTGTLLGTWFTSGIVRALLYRQSILAHPDRRSSHTTPIPQGGGIAVVGMTAVGWIGIGVMDIGDYPSLAAILAAALSLAIISWFDDVGTLPIAPRLMFQAAAVTVVMLLAPTEALTQGILPLPIDRLLTALLWVWFINLFNFMDGIDGIAGVETLCVCIGVAGVASIAGSGGDLIMQATILGAAMAGFLPWNWHPAKLFLGDVGSVPVGFMIGWLLLELAGNGHWLAALILPSYYLSDATLTLIRRAIHGKAVWKPHREHFYQRAVNAGLSHKKASMAVAITGAWLLCCALLSAIPNPPVLFTATGATLGVVGLLCYFQRAAHSTPAAI